MAIAVQGRSGSGVARRSHARIWGAGAARSALSRVPLSSLHTHPGAIDKSPRMRGKRAQPSALALRTAQETACAPLTAIARPRATARRGASGRKRVRAGRSLALRRSWGAADRRCCRREHPRFRACSTLERVRCGVRAGMRKPMPGRPGFGAACIGRGQPGRDAAAVGLAVSSEAQILDGDDRAGTEHGDSRAGRVGDEHPWFAAGSALLP